jgi:hypothetical protein
MNFTKANTFSRAVQICQWMAMFDNHFFFFNITTQGWFQFFSIYMYRVEIVSERARAVIFCGHGKRVKSKKRKTFF